VPRRGGNANAIPAAKDVTSVVDEIAERSFVDDDDLVGRVLFGGLPRFDNHLPHRDAVDLKVGCAAELYQADLFEAAILDPGQQFPVDRDFLDDGGRAGKRRNAI
jgi:hypothetical protein